MKKVLSKCTAVLMSVLICGSTMSVFAASTPSVSTDVTSGYDDGTDSSTAYGEFSVGQNAKTDVYLTVDSSDVVAGVPTCVILDGKAING